MVLFNINRAQPAVAKRHSKTEKKAAALAKTASRQTTATGSDRPWDTSALPRTIRTRLMARTSKADSSDKQSRLALGQYLGTAADANALASVQAAAQAQAKRAAPEAGGAGEEVLYMDAEGNVHLGIRPGDDKDIFNAMRQLQAEEQQATTRAMERRVPQMVAQRRSAAAAARRAPRAQQPVVPRAARRKATHACFQPRRSN